MIKNVIFDFGAVLVDWNPHYLYDAWFGSPEKASWFLENICTSQWNAQMDGGKPFAQGVAELTALHPEWREEIEMYDSQWERMMGAEIPGMYGILSRLRSRGFRLWGLTNWSSEKFYLINRNYPVFDLLDGMVVSGDVHLLKPSAGIFRALTEKYGLKPEECIFVDDNADNVAGAEAFGISAIRFTGAEALKTELMRRGLQGAFTNPGK